MLVLTYFEHGGHGLVTKIKPAGGTEISFSYDALLRRVKMVEGAVTTSFKHDGIDLLEVSDSSGNLTKITHGYKVIDGIGSVVEIEVNGTRYYLHQDHRGTTYKITNSAGDTIWTGLCNAWGDIISETGTNPSIFWYQGQAWWKLTVNGRLYYVSPTRIYDVQDGRFVKRDMSGRFKGAQLYYSPEAPLIPGVIDRAETNLYLYALGSPTAGWAVDPQGLFTPVYVPTVRSVESIQAIVGVKADGKYGPTTAQRVQEFQMMLSNAGYDVGGAADGKWGAKTEKAYLSAMRELQHKGPGNLRTFLPAKSNDRKCNATANRTCIGVPFKDEWEPRLDNAGNPVNTGGSRFSDEALAKFGGDRISDNAQLGNCTKAQGKEDGVLRLIVAGHANATILSIGGGSVVPAAERAKRSLNADNIGTWLPYFDKQRFCCGCQIWFIACNFGNGAFPQQVADKSGCKVYAYTDSPHNWSSGGAPW